jgi:hypothetical protein
MTHSLTAVLGLLAVCVTSAGAQQHQLRAEWGQNVTEFRGQNGRRVTLVCPPEGRSRGDVYGTDAYTDDSSVCIAAVHAGVITADRGGAVTIVMGEGRDRYEGTSRNGVETQSFNKTSGSFTFDRKDAEGQVDWGTSAAGLSLVGRPLTVICPPRGKSTGVWGTDTYTGDSSICGAAVHAGVITFEAGGRVTIEDAGAQRSHTGSSRNGVSSKDYAGFPHSFRVSSSPVVTAGARPITRAGVAPPPERPSRTALPSLVTVQTLTTPNLTVVGLTVPLTTTRSITTPAFSVVGTTAPLVTTRTITTPHFSIVGP